MNYLIKKAAYLEGLVDGLSIDEKSNEGKILIEMVDLIGDMAEIISDTIESQIDLEDYVDLLDEDLTVLEDDFYDDDEYYDDFDDYYFDDFDNCCNDLDFNCDDDLEDLDIEE